jgi:hypothetical protein
VLLVLVTFGVVMLAVTLILLLVMMLTKLLSPVTISLPNPAETVA